MSVILALVPATSVTAAAVLVAIPLRRCIKFNAVRSPVRTFLALPSTTAITSPFTALSPSLRLGVNEIFGSTLENM